MSTRAIIAIKEKDDTFTGAWVWFDAFPFTLGRKLKTFKNEEDVRELISAGDLNCIISSQEIKVEKPSQFSQILPLKLSGKRKVYIRQATDRELFPPKRYETIEKMRGQDINYVYVFDPSNCRWKTYK